MAGAAGTKHVSLYAWCATRPSPLRPPAPLRAFRFPRSPSRVSVNSAPHSALRPVACMGPGLVA
eukprot:4140423-Prymnesium_polylepis.1